MNWFTGFVLYVVIWWLALFVVLPWGVRIPDRPEPGMATSAPERPRIWLKIAVTSGLSAVLWLIAYAIIMSDLVTLRPPPGSP